MKNNNVIMTPENIVDELRERFKLSVVELRGGLHDYEIEIYCDALGITETTLFWAIENYRRNKKEGHLKVKIYPTKENRRN